MNFSMLLIAPAADAIGPAQAEVPLADLGPGEVGYLARPSSRGFERPYGWGWLLKLQNVDQIQVVQFTRSHYSDPNFAPEWNVQ